MDKVVTMTLLPSPSPPPPPPPSSSSSSSTTKKQTSQELNQVVGQQTVSIRTVSIPSQEEATGATVFVGGSAPADDSSPPTFSSSRTRIPEVQSTNGHECQKILETSQQQQQQQHVVKIRINPNNDNGKVISSVRLNPDYSNQILVCATSDLVKDQPVRINVINGKNEHQKDHIIQATNNGGFYYGTFQSPLANMVMSSGQCSPSDTLDSGTCSDLDGTPPPLPKKKSSTILLCGEESGNHHRTGSLTSSGAEIDSDDDDNRSNISCDSLNSAELSGINGCKTQLPRTTKLEIVLVKGSNPDLRNDHRDLINNPDFKNDPNLRNLDPDDLKNDPDDLRKENLENLPSNSSSAVKKKVSGDSRVPSEEFGENRREESWSPMVKECTYEERKQEQERLEQEYSAANYYANYNRSLSGTKYVYDDDRFYKFHLNERCCNEENLKETKVNGNGAVVEGDDKENDEYFAGYKILEREAIRSAKGTVRGVKNRVRAGIATFLQKPSTKNYKTKDAGKVVVYTTTMGIVRETYYACMKVKQILRTHLVKYEERDMFMSTESQTELRDRISSTTIQVPQLFIDGQYIGDADTVERLNESGELRLMLKPYKSPDACTTCKICGGYRLLPCPVCNGSKKSVHRNDFTTEFVALKCMNCDEVGLVRCQHC